MITIYYTFVNASQEKEITAQIEHLLSPVIRQRIAAYTSSRDRTLKIAGKWLLGELLAHQNAEAGITLDDLVYDQWGKPYFPGRNIQFSIAHSGTLAICALAGNQDIIGIDAEQIKSLALPDIEDYLTSVEQLSITSAADPTAGFYNLWTRKEAVLKASGKGVGIPFAMLDVLENPAMIDGKSWYWSQIHIAADYSIHLASNCVQEEPFVQELILPV